MKFGRNWVTNDQVRHLVAILVAISFIRQSPYWNLGKRLIKAIHIKKFDSNQVINESRVSTNAN